jgi:hypothetical protein
MGVAWRRTLGLYNEAEIKKEDVDAAKAWASIYEASSEQVVKNLAPAFAMHRELAEANLRCQLLLLIEGHRKLGAISGDRMMEIIERDLLAKTAAADLLVGTG